LIKRAIAISIEENFSTYFTSEEKKVVTALWKAKVPLMDVTATEEFHLLHHGRVDSGDKEVWMIKMDDPVNA
jgi:hypothetical protein